jgi:hypothetical protein
VAIERGSGGRRKTTHFEDIGAYRFVLGQPEIDNEASSERALRTLVEDEERYADLIKTFDTFIHLHGSVNAVARDLFTGTHRAAAAPPDRKTDRCGSGEFRRSVRASTGADRKAGAAASKRFEYRVTRPGRERLAPPQR